MYKKIFVCTFSILIIMMLLILSSSQSLMSKVIINAQIPSSNDLKEENIQLQHKIKSLEGTISLLKEALDEFGATTPDDSANIWAKGIQTRNGYLQYYVLCDEMKKEFKDELSKSKRTSWVTGYSSPWVSSYDIVNKEKVNSLTYKFTINFNWANSMGPKDSTKITITTTKQNTNWCISHINWNDIMKKRIF